MNLEKVTIIIGNQKFYLSKAFVGGIMDDFTAAPVGLFSGDLDLADTNIALMSLLRAVIKINTEEQGMNLQQSQKFIEFALQKAIEHETENKGIHNASMKQHETILKMKKDSWADNSGRWNK